MRLSDELRAAGVRLVEVPGWETGSSSRSFTPVGVMWHHTACRPPGCEQGIINNNLANFVIRRDGTAVLVTQRRAFHAGWGWLYQRDLIRRGQPPTLPTRWGNGYGNQWFFGLEIDYAPQSPYSETMTAAQMDTSLAITVVLLRRMGTAAHAVLSHREWTTRKGDPGQPFGAEWRPIPMAPIRAKVAELLGQPPIGDDDMLYKGDKSDDVRVLQARLNHAGYTDPNGAALTVDGDYGPNTAHAVGNAQADRGYHIDGDRCRDALLADLKPEPVGGGAFPTVGTITYPTPHPFEIMWGPEPPDFTQ